MGLLIKARSHDYKWLRAKDPRPVVMIICKCGVRSPWFDEESEWEETINWANAHRRA